MMHPTPAFRLRDKSLVWIWCKGCGEFYTGHRTDSDDLSGVREITHCTHVVTPSIDFSASIGGGFRTEGQAAKLHIKGG